MVLVQIYLYSINYFLSILINNGFPRSFAGLRNIPRHPAHRSKGPPAFRERHGVDYGPDHQRHRVHQQDAEVERTIDIRSHCKLQRTPTHCKMLVVVELCPGREGLAEWGCGIYMHML